MFGHKINTFRTINKASRKDPKALQTLDLFFEIFAKFLAEISLVYMPGNGIFISGSLMRNLEKIINKKKFKKNFRCRKHN